MGSIAKTKSCSPFKKELKNIGNGNKEQFTESNETVQSEKSVIRSTRSKLISKDRIMELEKERQSLKNLEKNIRAERSRLLENIARVPMNSNTLVSTSSVSICEINADVHAPSKKKIHRPHKKNLHDAHSPVKKKRGRPRQNPTSETFSSNRKFVGAESDDNTIRAQMKKIKTGRPRKYTIPEKPSSTRKKGLEGENDNIGENVLPVRRKRGRPRKYSLQSGMMSFNRKILDGEGKQNVRPHAGKYRKSAYRKSIVRSILSEMVLKISSTESNNNIKSPLGFQLGDANTSAVFGSILSKRKRGRPRKHPLKDQNGSKVSIGVGIKRKRGRPRKYPLKDEGGKNQFKENVTPKISAGAISSVDTKLSPNL